MIIASDVGLTWGGHKAALRWLWLLYRSPRQFNAAVKPMTRFDRVGFGVALYLHVLPYMLLVTLIGQWVRLQARGLPIDSREIVVGIAIGIAGGTAFGIVLGIALGIAIGLALGIAGGISHGIAVGLALGIAGGIGVGIAGRSVGAITSMITVVIAGVTMRENVFGSASSLLLPLLTAATRAYYWVPSLPFVWPQLRPRWYRFHPAAWDDLCEVPFWRLDRLLVALAEESPHEGLQAINRLIDINPQQRWAALRASTTLVAREAGNAPDLASLETIAAQLPQGEKKFLAEVPRVQEGLADIASHWRRLDATARPQLREPQAELVLAKVQAFLHACGGLQEPLRTEFRNAARKWEVLARRQLDAVLAQSQRTPFAQAFRAGDPVDRDREAYLPRDRVTGELEQQILLASGCPGVILYGRRRMGKSTVLGNLRGELPAQVECVVVSMQNPEMFTSVASLCAELGRHVAPDREPPTDLRELFRLLGDRDQSLKSAGRRLLLAIDEYENIDAKIGTGQLPEDLLATMRESIQKHRNITWLLAGSHEITDLANAPWTSYLVSALTIEVPPFSLAETRVLLTEPFRSSTLWPKDSPKRPRFAAEFWGPGGIERIQEETAGWPHLVQLVAATCVDLANETPDCTALTPKLFEEALNRALVSGHTVLYELLHRECKVPGEWEYIEGFRNAETQDEPADHEVARSLRRRELVEIRESRWRLRVPLMRRWLIARG